VIEEEVIWVSNDFTPYPVCWLQLIDGRQIQARYAAGDWEALDGHWVRPSDIVKWSPLRIEGLKGVYTKEIS
jgi:hypothetical protein